MTNQGWKAPEAAEKYKELVDLVAPGRREILTAIARLVTETASGPLCIMDIGCGWGDVSAEILKYSPDARVVMSDFSEVMVDITSERFKGNPNVSVFQHDLNTGLGSFEEKNYDAVVSCFALHHLEYENRVGLYSDIRTVLKPTGVFINGDLFKCDSLMINEWEFDNYIRWMAVQLKEKLGQEHTFSALKTRQLNNYQTMGDKPGTVWDMYNDLKAVGFPFVDCICKYQNLAVLAAGNR